MFIQQLQDHSSRPGNVHESLDVDEDTGERGTHTSPTCRYGLDRGSTNVQHTFLNASLESKSSLQGGRPDCCNTGKASAYHFLVATPVFGVKSKAGPLELLWSIPSSWNWLHDRLCDSVALGLSSPRGFVNTCLRQTVAASFVQRTLVQDPLFDCLRVWTFVAFIFHGTCNRRAYGENVMISWSPSEG